MSSSDRENLLRRIPSIAGLLATDTAKAWLDEHPHSLVADCLRAVVDELRTQIQSDDAGRCGARHVAEQFVLQMAELRLADMTQPRLRCAINATGIILHTGLGRAVWPETVVDSMVDELKGYVTLAIDRDSGKRINRDRLIEYILCELTGAEAATVVNNNAAATMLALAALAAEREVIVSRGQLIEIGGSFRLPDVMRQSTAHMVEVGTTNRTHLRDYAEAITDQTAAIMRAHPSNFRVVGFTAETPLEELVELGHASGLVVIDDLGAGALVDLSQFGLPHEPVVKDSIRCGADVVLFSADKLIGAGQGGIIVGRKEPIERIRKHPLARAMRADKTCLMALERTLQLFRDPPRLTEQHPTYRMFATPMDVLKKRAETLAEAITAAVPAAEIQVVQGIGYVGSGSLPMHELATYTLRLALPSTKAAELARQLRMDEACVFARVEDEQVVMDVRTVTDRQLSAVASAVGRAGNGTGR